MKTNSATKHGHVFDTSKIEPRCIKCGLRIRIDDSALHDAFERIESEPKSISKRMQKLLVEQVEEYIERYHPNIRTYNAEVSPCGTRATAEGPAKKMRGSRVFRPQKSG